VTDTTGSYRENTRESCRRAVELGATWVEIDVVRTADEALVLSHELELGTKTRISAVTTRDAEAAGLVTLEALFDALDEGVGVVVEVKTPRAGDPVTTALAIAAVRAERQRRPERGLVTYGFAASTATLLSVPGVSNGVIAGPHRRFSRLLAEAERCDAVVIAPHVRTLLPFGTASARDGERRIRSAHEAGLSVMAWTASPGEAAILAEAGVDAVCVDDVAGTAQILGR
jgi:glycerophosphoryl diester phosphodiesterase